MLDSIKKLLAAPTFEDEEKNRIARMLNIILWGVILLVGILVVVRIIEGDGSGSVIIINSSLILMAIALQFVMRWGYVRAASLLLISLGWLALTFQAGLTGGIRDTAFIAYFVIILIANLLLGWQAGAVFFGMSVLAGWGFAYAEAKGIIISEVVSAYDIALDVTVIFGLAALILALTTASLSNALQRAKDSEHSLAESNRELQTLSQSLEQQVGARTRRLETVAALSERLSAILDVDQLLNEVVNQIQINFNYYHAHIYLLDEKQENLVMEAGTGSAGTEMKAKGHRISLQAVTSLVVRAARTSQIVTIDNVRESPDWLPNPLLPDTRAEMAVPIILDQKVVGVLDVQENRIAGLDDGDASLLRSLANQVAVAIRNARLFAEVETALAEVKEAQKRYVTEAWQKSKVSGIRHLYASPDVSISDNEQQQLMVDARKQTMTQGHPVIVDSEDDTDEKFLVAPISLRDQTIGVLKIKTAGSDHQSWDEDDLAMIDAVIDQIAQTAENLRLYDDTRRHAGREQTIRQISEKMRTTTNLEDLIQTAARELSEHFAADYAVVELGIKKDQV